jgi:hypothetical protein
MQQLLEKTQLPKSDCRQIWDLSNSQGLSQFNKPMFLIAMHLMYKRKKNPTTPIPSELPPELKIPAYEGEQSSALGIQSYPNPNVSASFQGEPKMQMSSAPQIRQTEAPKTRLGDLLSPQQTP